MSHKLAKAIVDILRPQANGRRLNVGLLLEGNLAVAEQVAAEGHRTVVMGDKFRLIYAFYRRVNNGDEPRPLTAETRFSALPIQKQSLDALVLSRGLPRGMDPQPTLVRLRNLLKDAGLLIWPHPYSDGLRGRVGKVLTKARLGSIHPLERQRLSALAMASGFVDVGQVLVRGPFVPWVVTSCRISPRPWESQTQKKSPY